LIAENIKGVRIEHLPTAFHMIHLICPEACAELVVEFCSQH
jgi:pimeloyl-ACP methyl ester carboxylesterase